jgi:hypothetical protein
MSVAVEIHFAYCLGPIKYAFLSIAYYGVEAEFFHDRQLRLMTHKIRFLFYSVPFSSQYFGELFSYDRFFREKILHSS